jgi:hypothetical protein
MPLDMLSVCFSLNQGIQRRESVTAANAPGLLRRASSKQLMHLQRQNTSRGLLNMPMAHTEQAKRIRACDALQEVRARTARGPPRMPDRSRVARNAYLMVWLNSVESHREGSLSGHDSRALRRLDTLRGARVSRP